MACNSITIDQAQFTPNIVEVETNTVTFGPTGNEGSVVMYDNVNDLEAFFLQDSSDDIEAVFSTMWSYTDGYAVRLTYSYAVSLADAVYATCLTADANNQSCWAFTQASGVPTNFVSYYETSSVSNVYDLGGSGTAITETCAYE